MALGHQYGLRSLTRPWASAQPSVVSEAMDINIDSGCSWTMDPEMAFGSSSGSDVTVTPCGSTDYSDRRDPGGGMGLGHQDDHRWQPRSWASLWSSMVTWDVDVNTDSGCSRTTGPDMVLGSHPGLDITLAPKAPHQPAPYHLCFSGSASSDST